MRIHAVTLDYCGLEACGITYTVHRVPRAPVNKGHVRAVLRYATLPHSYVFGHLSYKGNVDLAAKGAAFTAAHRYSQSTITEGYGAPW